MFGIRWKTLKVRGNIKVTSGCEKLETRQEEQMVIRAGKSQRKRRKGRGAHDFNSLWADQSHDRSCQFLIHRHTSISNLSEIIPLSRLREWVWIWTCPLRPSSTIFYFSIQLSPSITSQALSSHKPCGFQSCLTPRKSEEALHAHPAIHSPVCTEIQKRGLPNSLDRVSRVLVNKIFCLHRTVYKSMLGKQTKNYGARRLT